MSECNYWWRSGDVGWCDMMGEGCKCGGWDENCDMKLKRGKGAKVRFASGAEAAVIVMEDEEE